MEEAGRWILLVIAAIAFYTDARWRIIPNFLCAAGILLGMAVQISFSKMDGLIDSSIGVAIGFIPMFILYLLRAVGAGDVKLFAAVGALSNWKYTLNIMVGSVVLAGCIGMFILLWNQKFARNIRELAFRMLIFARFKQGSWNVTTRSMEYTTFPFMYAVFPTAIYYLFIH